jgi:hypothetical protein
MFNRADKWPLHEYCFVDPKHMDETMISTISTLKSNFGFIVADFPFGFVRPRIFGRLRLVSQFVSIPSAPLFRSLLSQYTQKMAYASNAASKSCFIDSGRRLQSDPASSGVPRIPFSSDSVVALMVLPIDSNRQVVQPANGKIHQQICPQPI